MATTLMTADMAARVVDALVQRHGRLLGDERFRVSATLEDKTVVVTLRLERDDETHRYEMQAAKAIPDNGSLSPAGTLDLCLDFLDWYLGEYFRADRELLLPLDWQPHRIGEHDVLARGDVRNPVLDDAADAWLRGERPDSDTLERRAGRKV